MKREPGWYWVKGHESHEWTPAEWQEYAKPIAGEEGCWWFEECPCQDADLHEIDERRIVRQET